MDLNTSIYRWGKSLSAIIVLAIMILPTLINISETALKAVPDDYRKAHLL